MRRGLSRCWSAAPPTVMPCPWRHAATSAPSSARRSRGKILNWLPLRGYGFLEEDKTKQRYFVHSNEVPSRAALSAGAVVEFVADENGGKRRALTISVVSGMILPPGTGGASHLGGGQHLGKSGGVRGAGQSNHADGGGDASNSSAKRHASGISPHPAWNFVADGVNAMAVDAAAPGIFTRPLSEEELALIRDDELGDSDFFDTSEIEQWPTDSVVDRFLRSEEGQQAASANASTSKEVVR